MCAPVIFVHIAFFSFQTCFYCKLKGASIGCNVRSCKKSFHLNCGIKNNGLTEFYGKYRSFCHLHVPIERSTIHSASEKCMLCMMDMGKFHSASSVELPCCKNKWYHSHCLKKMAREQTTPKCRNCGDAVDKNVLLSNGIFVENWYVCELWVMSFGILYHCLNFNWFNFNCSSEDENSESDNDQPSPIPHRSNTPNDVLDALSGET